MKKIIIISLVLSLSHLFIRLIISGGEATPPQPGNLQKKILPLSSKTQQTIYEINNNLECSNGIIDTLTWRNEGASKIINFPFISTGESLLVWLNPVAACSLLAIRFRPVDWKGDMLLDIWDASNYNPLIYSTDSTDENGWWGKYDPEACPSCWVPGDIVGHTPLGWNRDDLDHHYWGPSPFIVMSEHANSWIEISADSAPQGKVDLGSNPFFISAMMYINGGWGFYAQEPYHGAVPYSFFKFWSQPELGSVFGWFLHSDLLWFEAIVKYYQNTPPVIQKLENQSHTYFSGPFLIDVTIEDFDPENINMAGIAYAELVYTINSLESRTTMGGPTKGGLFTAEIPKIAVGDVVTYWIEATDILGLTSKSEKNSFKRTEPVNPDADILLIWNNFKDPNGDILVDSLFATVRGSGGEEYTYELWNSSVHNGIDASVMNYGWKTIYVSNWGKNDLLPGYAYDGNLLVDWLENGTIEKPHNLLFFDQDYFCYQKKYGCMWDGHLTEGDFLHDYFDIHRAVSDNHGTLGAVYDKEAIGETGTPFEGIQVDFQPEAQNLSNYLRPDWLTTLGDEGEQIFFYLDSGYGAGVQLDRRYYKTCFMPWPDFFAFDSLENGEFVPREALTNTVETVLEWFGTDVVREHRCSGLVGDPTGDGNIDIFDVLVIVNHILGFEYMEDDAFCRGDCTADSTIDVRDVIGVVRSILGLGECEL